MCIMTEKIGAVASKTKQPSLQGSVSAYLAIEVMDIYEIDIIAVECEDNFVGTFSRKDLQKNVIKRNLEPNEVTLYECMTLNPPIAQADMSVKQAYEMMLAYQWNFIPVTRGKKLVGIVSMNDLGKDVMKSYEEAKSENETIMSYLKTGESYVIANYDQ